MGEAKKNRNSHGDVVIGARKRDNKLSKKRLWKLEEYEIKKKTKSLWQSGSEEQGESKRI